MTDKEKLAMWELFEAMSETLFDMFYGENNPPEHETEKLDPQDLEDIFKRTCFTYMAKIEEEEYRGSSLLDQINYDMSKILERQFQAKLIEVDMLIARRKASARK